jgi:hypothetical protein
LGRLNQRLGFGFDMQRADRIQPKAKTVLALIGLAVLLSLPACRSAEEELHAVSEKIAVPSDAKLLANMIEQNQGSQDACYSTARTELYGSSLYFQEIKSFYATQLTDAGWELLSPEMEDVYRLGNQHQVAVSDVTDNEFIISQFDDIDTEELGSFQTMYTVTLVNPDWIARNFCPAWSQ